MVVKRQRKEKACKNRTEYGLRTRVKTSSETALLASPIYIGQAQGEEKKHIQRGAKIEPLLFTSLDWPTLTTHS